MTAPLATWTAYRLRGFIIRRSLGHFHGDGFFCDVATVTRFFEFGQFGFIVHFAFSFQLS